MKLMEVTPQHEDLVKESWKALKEWRRFLIGIHGRDGSGKSTLARFLAWQMGMPAIETDLFLDEKRQGFFYDECSLKSLIEARFRLKRPVVLEGVFLLRILESIGLTPDYLIYTRNENHGGAYALQNCFAEYEKNFTPSEKANFVFSWKEDASSGTSHSG